MTADRKSCNSYNYDDQEDGEDEPSTQLLEINRSYLDLIPLIPSTHPTTQASSVFARIGE